MVQRLPVHVRPLQLARRSQSLAGEMSLGEMTRLNAGGFTGTGPARLALDFSLGLQGLAQARGKLEAEMESMCQRCLKPMTLALSVPLKLVFSEDAQANVPDDHDNIEVVDGKLDIQELVEDELILALPITPLHNDDICELANERPESEPATTARKMPFAMLAKLKDTN